MQSKYLLALKSTRMKKILLFFIGMTLLSSCTDSTLEKIVENEKETKALSVHKISKSEALEIANTVLGNPVMTKGRLSFPKFDYVLKEKTKSNTSLQDTVAYIINYPDNNGFVIVSGDNRVYPVLAFSETGTFSSENEIAQKNFIDGIEYYLENNSDSDVSYTVDGTSFDSCYAVSPFVSTGLHQGNPYNKYVVEEYPNCPAGCVAVATALVMTYSESDLEYHDEEFYFEAMNTAIINGPDAAEAKSMSKLSPVVPIVPILPTITYTYEEAVDLMAKLLYWIGKDVNMSYKTTGSGASSYDAFELIKSLGFELMSDYETFNIDDISWYLKDGCIVYLRGRDLTKDVGHAWISDGCRFCVDMLNDPTKIIETYIHCNWGWGGSSDGYYSGSVFAASSYNFTPQNYFAVKRNQ